MEGAWPGDPGRGVWAGNASSGLKSGEPLTELPVLHRRLVQGTDQVFDVGPQLFEFLGVFGP
ncbi:hypothetical protein CTZ27_35530 [Streptomyces griseocarneus]|nr:hypothetical protein CTZ27_35530 [Streptomyces griseocarneus]